jgi:hypothetical protein
MPEDTGKAPRADAPRRPLAKWALATLAADALLAAGLARVSPPIALAEPRRIAAGSRLSLALTVADRAVFVWRIPGDSSALAVVVSRAGPVAQRALPASLLETARANPCALLDHLQLGPGCPAGVSLGPPSQPTAGTRRWWSLTGRQWSERETRARVIEGHEASGAVTVRATVDGAALVARRGFRVAAPTLEFSGRRYGITRDLRVEDLLRADDRSASGGPFFAGPRGERLALSRDGTRIQEPATSLASVLAGRLGPDGLAATVGAWLGAQIAALAAARASGSSEFWRRFLQWSALLATFVTGALALAAHKLADGAW